ncbi:MAG: hypothetical protein COT91_00560 [Candidatus Doudnabacteria bacterium CG10_big_fil_rev_8_21_14_0_10_41_10]|uniref:SHS2 domain-containing protein n=1 Tax=Candidatus Doudnabacteria bacterium CG10_big_fil_rev_8_21_14_0_10_41_10 TaxID=1974551 RepID=A0A2H0VH58_9BACT|nr:MAG: hypothetical protein COT91_00560 [Candidatus Doudnabacteria bacterium CG10_big_fil_rev_8_21_14_0_10_41_10]
MLFSRSKSVLGIDIGTSYIKAVQIKQEKGTAILESYGMVHVVYPAGGEGKFNILDQTAEVLSDLYKRSNFTTKKVVVSMPANMVFVSILNLPSIPEKDIQSSIEYKAQKYIPLPLQDVNLSWQIIRQEKALKVPILKKKEDKEDIEGEEPVAPKQDQGVDVLLTALAKNVVNNYLHIIDAAGLEPVALEVETLSQIRALVGPQTPNGVLIVDIGAKTTNLTLVDRGYLYGSRHLTVGGDSITDSIASAFGVSFDRAEEIKRSSFQKQTVTPTLQVAGTVIEIIKSECEQLMKIMTSQGKKVSEIILTGGGSELENIDQEFILLGPKVTRGNPLAKIIYDPKVEAKLSALSSQLTVGVGLALRTEH